MNNGNITRLSMIARIAGVKQVALFAAAAHIPMEMALVALRGVK